MFEVGEGDKSLQLQRFLVVSVATEDRQFLHTTRFSTRQSHSVSLSGLPLRSWAVVAPRRFPFTITALTVDQGSSSRAEICLKGVILWRCYIESHWALQQDQATANVCRWRLQGCVLNFYTPVSNGCDWNSRIHYFEVVSTYWSSLYNVFCIYTVF